MILKFRENRVRRAYLGGKRIDRFTKEHFNSSFGKTEWR